MTHFIFLRINDFPQHLDYNLYSYLKVKEDISQAYNTTGNIIILYIESFSVFEKYMEVRIIGFLDFGHRPVF
jgi:hypothetical protein